MFPSRVQSLSLYPSIRYLRSRQVRSLISWRNLSVANLLIGRSTSPSISTEVYLRVVSGGTRYCRPRIAFNPYTQDNQTISTSELVRSSTQISQAFNLLKRRSTGFGSSTNDSRIVYATPPLLCGYSLSLRLLFKRLTSPSVETPWSVLQHGKQDTGLS